MQETLYNHPQNNTELIINSIRKEQEQKAYNWEQHQGMLSEQAFLDPHKQAQRPALCLFSPHIPANP